MTAFRDIQPAEQREHTPSRFVIDCAGAQLYVHARSVATILRFTGDIDAANAGLVAEVIRRFTLLKAPLIVDLSHLNFLGLTGFRVLLGLNEDGEAEQHCCVVAGAAVRRLTRVVTNHGVPIAESISEALLRVEGSSPGAKAAPSMWQWSRFT